MKRVASRCRVVIAVCLAAIGTFQGARAATLNSVPFSALAVAHSAAAPTEDHEYYGTLIFEDGQRLTGGPAIQPRKIIYIDALGTQRLVALQSTGKDAMAGGGAQVKWSRDAEGRLVAAEFVYGDGRTRTARFEGTRSEPIEVENEGDRIVGRLHLPAGDGPHPALVLIHGSGDSTSRWGTFVSFFVDLGMAVVGFDKRGVGASEGDWRDGSFEVLAEDAARFVDALSDRPDIDRERIGLMGHSEGGWVAPITAARRKNVAFVLVRVGPAVPPPDVHSYGLYHHGVRRGMTGAALEAWGRLCKIFGDALRDKQSFESMQEKLDPLRKEGWLSKWSPGGGVMNGFRHEWEFLIRTADHDPADYLSTLRAPVLWFLGDADVNVETKTTVAALDSSVSDHPDATVVVLPGLDHSFADRSEQGVVRYAPGFWVRTKDWLSKRGLTGR